MAVEPSSTVLEYYFEDLRRRPVLSREEEQELARAARAGDLSARERLIASNLRFVVKLAKRYRGLGLPLEDLVGEGNRGMVRAAETFDPSRGVRFISYAMYHIRVRIDIALARAPSFRRSLHKEREARRVRQLARRLSSQFGAGATSHEIAQALAMDEAEVSAALNVFYAQALEETAGDGGLPLLERLPSADPLPDELATEAERQQRIAAVLETLPEREAAVLRLWYGFDGPPLTHQEIADRFGLTRQRIQQIAETALKRLREPSRARRLKGLLDVPPTAAIPPARRGSAPRRRRKPGVSAEVETLRRFFREEVERTTLRATARAAGLKRSGLAKFVAGGTYEPNPENLALMRAFYLDRHPAAGTGTLPGEPAETIDG